MNLFNIQKTFEMKKAKGWPEIYFCIDLHGTIIPSGHTESDQEEKLYFYPDAREVLQYLSARKDILMILWTSTPLERIGGIWNFFMKSEVYFDYFNQNPHAANTPRSDFGKKFYFNVLLDDRAGFEPKTDWTLIKNKLIEIGEWKETLTNPTEPCYSNV